MWVEMGIYSMSSSIASVMQAELNSALHWRYLIRSATVKFSNFSTILLCKLKQIITISLTGYVYNFNSQSVRACRPESRRQNDRTVRGADPDQNQQWDKSANKSQNTPSGRVTQDISNNIQHKPTGKKLR